MAFLWESRITEFVDFVPKNRYLDLATLTIRSWVVCSKYNSNKKGTLRTNDLAVCGKQQPKSFGVDHENHSTLALIHDKTATLWASNTFLLTYGIELGENWILPFQKAQPIVKTQFLFQITLRFNHVFRTFALCSHRVLERELTRLKN